MPTFSGLFTAGGARVPKDKILEYEQLLEKLLQSGGMMEKLFVEMYDIRFFALKKASMYETGMNFTYNYFEDNSWENVLYNRKSMLLWSESIGWSEFCTVVNSAYVLETLYLDGPGVAIEDDVVVNPRPVIRWISYLSDKPIPSKGTGPWDLYELLHRTKSFMANVEWWRAKDYIAYYADDKAGYKEWLSVLAVQKGTLSAEYRMERKKSEKESIDIILNGARIILHLFHDTEKNDENSGKETQLLELLRRYYRTDLNEEEFEQECTEAGTLPLFGEIVAVLDMPQMIVELIAEEYDLDFWELWDSIKDDIKESKKHHTADQLEETPQPLSTVEFLNIREDSMIPYWDGGDSIQFSAELETWFAEMKEKFDIVMESGKEFGGEDPVPWVIKLVEFAASEYVHVYVFNDFLNETIDHINDRRYIALWAVYEDMLYDPEMLKTASVVFRDGDYVLGRSWWQTRRPLKDWCFQEPEDKWNKARVTMRNYMALVGNQKLREKVFGF